MRFEKQVEKFAKFEAADNLWKALHTPFLDFFMVSVLIHRFQASVIEMVEARSAITTYRCALLHGFCHTLGLRIADSVDVLSHQAFNEATAQEKWNIHTLH